MCGRKTNVHGGVAGFLLIGHSLYKILVKDPICLNDLFLLNWRSFQYFVDSKLDQVFHEFLVDLVTDEEFIPPNPYPRLTTHLTVAAIRW